MEVRMLAKPIIVMLVAVLTGVGAQAPIVTPSDVVVVTRSGDALQLRCIDEHGAIVPTAPASEQVNGARGNDDQAGFGPAAVKLGRDRHHGAGFGTRDVAPALQSLGRLAEPALHAPRQEADVAYRACQNNFVAALARLLERRDEGALRPG